MTLPRFAGGGHPAGMLARAGFTARIDVAERDTYRVFRSPLPGHDPALVRAEKIAGRGVPWPRTRRLAELAANAPVPVEPEQNPQRLRQDLKRMGEPRDPVDLLARWQLLCSSASNQDLPARMVEAYEGLRTWLAEDGSPAFPDAAVHIVMPSPALHTRAKTTSFLVRLDYDRRLREGDIDHVVAVFEDGEAVFSSSEALWEGLYLFDAYLGPLLGALSPAVWAFAVPRSLGVLVFSLGETLNGRRQGAPAEPLQMLATRDLSGQTDFPTLAPRAASDALSWWYHHLQRFLEVVSDPRVFAGPDGVYRPARHLQCLASVEQVFRLVHSIQTSHRDSVARRALMHTVMDSLEGLLGYSTEKMCTLSFARASLIELQTTMSERPAALLLDAARRGVEALAQLQEGFFLPPQLNSHVVAVPGKADLSLEAAAAHYVKVLRNATHSYGGKPGSSDSPRTEALDRSPMGRAPTPRSSASVSSPANTSARPTSPPAPATTTCEASRSRCSISP